MSRWFTIFRTFALAFVASVGVQLAALAQPYQAPIVDPKTTIRFCYQDIELYPNYMGEGAEVPSEKPGVNIELYNLVAANAGAAVQYFRYSWNRCIALLTAGRVDSLIASYNTERASLAKFPQANGQLDASKRITTSGYYLYHLKNDTTYWDGEKLLDPSISIGAPLGYSIVNDLRAMNANVTEAGTTGSLLNLLLYGRFDAIAAPGSTTQAMIRADITRLINVVRDPAPLKQSAYYIVFSDSFAARNPALVEEIWNQSKLVREQFREELLLKY